MITDVLYIVGLTILAGACIPLGGLAVVSPETAVLIAMQNLPEGFNAYRELASLPDYTSGKTLLFMGCLVITGPLAGLPGYFFCQSAR